MSRWIWIDIAVVLAVHDEQLAEHGGSPGVRDRGLLESALARPKNLDAYEPEADIAPSQRPAPTASSGTIRSSTATSAPGSWRSSFSWS
jgi:hypothetical protein